MLLCFLLPHVLHQHLQLDNYEQCEFEAVFSGWELSRLQRSRDVNNVHQCHMSEIADAPPWDSCDVTQLSHHLQRIKKRLRQHKRFELWQINTLTSTEITWMTLTFKTQMLLWKKPTFKAYKTTPVPILWHRGRTKPQRWHQHQEACSLQSQSQTALCSHKVYLGLKQL